MRSIIISIILCSVFVISFLNVNSQVAAVRINVRVPEPDANEKGVFLTGSFNNWQTADSLYRMNKMDENLYSIIIPVFDGKRYEYKYTLGNWDRVEVAGNDSNIQNRYFISSNNKNISDTVVKWKQPKQAGSINPQMQRLNSMKDSALNKLKPELNDMLGLLKSYVQNLLKEKPSARLQKKLDKKGAEKLGDAYKQITKLLWNIMSSLTPEQKELIQKQINEPAGKDDYLNTFLHSLLATIQGDK